MERIYESAGHHVRMSLPDATESVVDERMRRHVPDVSVSEADSADRTVELKSGEAGLSRTGSTVTVTAPAEKHHPMDLVMLSSRVFERAYNESGKCSVHGAAVTDGSTGVLLVGPSQSGKTTCAIALCARHDLRLISDDRTLIDSDGIIGGQWGVEASPELIETKLGIDAESEYSLGTTRVYDTRALGIAPFGNRVSIESIYFVDERDTALSRDELVPPTSTIELTRRASVFAKTKPDLLYGPGVAIPVHDDRESAQARFALVDGILGAADCYRIGGDFRSIADAIYRAEFQGRSD